MDALSFELHGAIVGSTGSGKTFFANKAHMHTPAASLFINTQADKVIEGERCDRHTPLKRIERLIIDKRKINYIPSSTQEVSMKELQAIFTLLRRLNRKVYLWVDEAHLYVPEGSVDTPLHQIARRGRHWGIHQVLISQRPADISKAVLTQASKHVVFKLNQFERMYFSKYGMDYEEIMGKIERGGEHSFVIVENGEVSRAYRLD